MAFCWFTTRVAGLAGLGYGWLFRGVYGLLAASAAWLGFRLDDNPVRDVTAVLVALACAAALAVWVAQREAGVSGRTPSTTVVRPAVAAMTSIDQSPARHPVGDRNRSARRRTARARTSHKSTPAGTCCRSPSGWSGWWRPRSTPEANPAVALVRTLAGAAFLGAITDAMLLGHWYLVQPGLPRSLLHELVGALGYVWAIEVAALLLPTGMISVWVGTVDDGWGGMLGWFWAASAATTIVLVLVTRAALRERQYAAVMAATGLLYLAILTAFGTDLVARAVLSGP